MARAMAMTRADAGAKNMLNEKCVGMGMGMGMGIGRGRGKGKEMTGGDGRLHGSAMNLTNSSTLLGFRV